MDMIILIAVAVAIFLAVGLMLWGAMSLFSAKPQAAAVATNASGLTKAEEIERRNLASKRKANAA